VAWVHAEQSLKEVVMEMTRHPLGAACVVSNHSVLEGLITDGDVRRALQGHDDIRPVRAGMVMTTHPVTVGPEAGLGEALSLMEKRSRQISVLPVVEGTRCLGLVRLHDLCGLGS
jgi:arabinose-5-phosphate isomerase